MDKSTIIDTSEFQGDIDWSKAKDHIGGAILRAAIRGSLKETNPQYYMKLREDFSFRDNLAGVTKYGIPYTAYFFPTAITTAEAVEEAAYFWNIGKDLNVSYPFALDSENVWGKNHEAGRANDLSKEERTRLLKIILDYFEAHGKACGIYASAWWLNNKIDMSQLTESQRACTWVADSTGEVDYKGPYWLHQYGQESCPGIKGKVDANHVRGGIPVLSQNGETEEQADIIIDPVDTVLSIAEAEVGYHEKRSSIDLYSKTGNAGSGNYTKYGKEMHALQPRNMDYPAPWCFTAGTMILTSNGYKAIESIGVGDLVLNAYGNAFNKVVKILTRKERVNEMRAYGTLKLRSTGDHPFLSSQRLGVRKDWKHTEIEFRPLSKLCHGDNVVSPKTSELKKLSLTYDEAWCIGYFVGDGWKTSRGEYRICGNDAKEIEVFKHFDGIEKDKDYASRTCHEYRIIASENKNILPLLDCAGRGAENKIVPHPILFASDEIKTAFLDGYLTADGTKEGKFSTVSKALALGVAKIVFDLGYGCSLRECVRNEYQVIFDSRINDYRPIKIKPVIYCGAINTNPSKRNRMDRRDGNLIFVPVKYNNETGEEEMVYNVTVDGDHTYLANNLSVHNCDAFVDWCMVKAFGAETAKKVLCGDFDDYTYSSVNLYKKAGRWTHNAARGYQIFFGGSGHTGLVYKVEKGIVYTIEGNKSDEVRKCKYALTDGSIIGYGMPLYSIVAPEVVHVDDLHTVKWTGYTKRLSKVYTQPDTASVECSFSPVDQGEEFGACKRVGQFYFGKFEKVGKYGYTHRSNIRK